MSEDECTDEVTITVFPPMPGIGIMEEEPIVDEEDDSCGDSAPVVTIPKSSESEDIVITLTTKDPMDKITPLLEAAKARFGNSVCIRLASYDSREKLDEAIEWLNAALRGSGDNTVLDDQAFSTFIGSSAPILSINNRLSFVGLIPNENQFLTRIAAVLRLSG